MRIDDYVAGFLERFSFLEPSTPPWEVPRALPSIIDRLAASTSAAMLRHSDGVLVHPGAIVEAGAIIKPPALISDRCFVAATAYLRNGVFLDAGVRIGPGSEVKTTLVMAHSTLAHFNFVGDSIVGANVNIEAGAVVANHHNDRVDDEIMIHVGGRTIRSGVSKFGALIGDHCRLGANAVLSPGTVLEPHTIVGRLVLVDQDNPRGA